MENAKPKTEGKKGVNWEAVANFGAELVKLTIVAGLTAYITENVRYAVNNRKSADIIDFPSRKIA